MSSRRNKTARRRIIQYGQRNALLRRIGFQTYADYLASPLWHGIRLKVLTKHDHACRGCGKRANQVHHHAYTLENLTGKNLHCMSAICGKCHRRIEFDKKRGKLSPSEANKKLSKQFLRNNPTRSIKAKQPKPIAQPSNREQAIQDGYRQLVGWINGNTKGSKRRELLAEAIRHKAGLRNGSARSTGREHIFERLGLSVSWDRTQEVGGAASVASVAYGKSQSNATRTQCPPIPVGHQPGNTPPNDSLALTRA